jgi:hypothetical protein
MSGFCPEATNQVTQELVTPKYRATSAPEKPSSLAAIQEIESRASTTSRLRLPEGHSFRKIAYELFYITIFLTHNRYDAKTPGADFLIILE